MNCLLSCLLLLCPSEVIDQDLVTVDDHYNGAECDKSLFLLDYFRSDGTLTDLYGGPHYLWGFTKYRGESLLYCAKVTSVKKYWSKYDYSLSIPEDALNGTIDRIHAIDLNEPFKGGYAFLKEGGIGERYATLGFQSRLGRAMNYVIAVFGTQDKQ